MGAVDSGPHAGKQRVLGAHLDGAVLMVGDASHAEFGWENGVEPGSFTSDHERGAESFSRLQSLVKRHPAIDVRLGITRYAQPRGAPAYSFNPSSAVWVSDRGTER